MSFIRDNIPNIIAILLIAALLHACVKSLLKAKKQGLPSCACGKNCSACALRYLHGMADRKA